MSIIMEIEVSQIHPSQQDMELIDILWRQDIDLGARREVFDYSHRQKENELQRQRELEEEKRLHLLREQEKAFLAQLQLDEETGEYIPRPPTGDTPQSAAPPLEVTQNVNFTEDGDSMSFDECMQLLAETFPLVESIEDISTCLDTAVVPASSSNHIMMSPKQPPTPQTLLSPAPIPAERGSPELEQAWMELLSLPELQNCLTMQMENTPEPTTYLPEESPKVEDANYTFYPMPNVTNLGPNTVDNCPTNFINTFEAAFPTMVKAEQLSPVMVNANLGTDSFCDAIYTVPILVKKESSDDQGVMKQKESSTLPELPKKPPLKPMDIPCPSPRDAFERCKQETMGEVHESDSGVSLNTSPNSSSPEKSLYDDGSFGYSDTDMEELDINPGSAESDYSEMFSLNFQPDDFQLKSSQKHQPGKEQEKRPKQYKTKPIEEVGRSDAPFTKDKQKGRFEVRLSRDEQRAKTLQIPFSVDMIINLPVDDFNEMMSKHQLNEAQLALVRDIRRRGKNKVAAQNCRKRKMENIVGLEYELDSLKEEKEQLLEEKSQNSSSLRKMKQQLSSLYLEVFSMLRDEEGRPYSPSHYSLQQTTDGSVFLVPRNKKTITKSKEHKRASTD